MNTRKRNAAIFDLDGTLINSLGDIADTMNHLLSLHGLPLHTEDQYCHFIGNGIKNLITLSLPEECRSDNFVSSLHTLYNDEYRKRCLVNTRPYPGIPAMLDSLSETGIITAVLSNKTDEFTRYMVKEIFKGHNFCAVLGSREDIPRKPDPAGALMVAQQCMIEPSACFFIGDSGVDMQTGVNAGMSSVGVLWGFRSERELRESGAARVVSHPADIPLFFSE